MAKQNHTRKQKQATHTKKKAHSHPLPSKPLPTVKVYTTPTCPYCIMAKHWLTQKRISFQEFNVLENATARDYIIAKSKATSVPQIEIGKKVIVGFDREALEEQLVKKGFLPDRTSKPR